MRIIGTLSKWNDDRGFGFIMPNQIGDEIFVHISAFPGNGNRPTVGETISFEVAQVDGKTRAVKIQRPSGFRKPQSRPIEQSQREAKSLIGVVQFLIAAAVIATAGYVGYSRFSTNYVPESIALKQQTSAPVQITARSQHQFTCDGRQHCSEMSSYEEAKFFIANCPNTKMDGDGDGEPCERQF
jgi:cold shock CspA family protein